MNGVAQLYSLDIPSTIYRYSDENSQKSLSCVSKYWTQIAPFYESKTLAKGRIKVLNQLLNLNKSVRFRFSYRLEHIEIVVKIYQEKLAKFLPPEQKHLAHLPLLLKNPFSRFSQTENYLNAPRTVIEDYRELIQDGKSIEVSRLIKKISKEVLDGYQQKALFLLDLSRAGLKNEQIVYSVVSNLLMEKNAFSKIVDFIDQIPVNQTRAQLRRYIWNDAETTMPQRQGISYSMQEVGDHGGIKTSEERKKDRDYNRIEAAEREQNLKATMYKLPPPKTLTNQTTSNPGSSSSSHSPSSSNAAQLFNQILAKIIHSKGSEKQLNHLYDNILNSDLNFGIEVITKSNNPVHIKDDILCGLAQRHQNNKSPFRTNEEHQLVLDTILSYVDDLNKILVFL